MLNVCILEQSLYHIIICNLCNVIFKTFIDNTNYEQDLSDQEATDIGCISPYSTQSPGGSKSTTPLIMKGLGQSASDQLSDGEVFPVPIFYWYLC